MNNTDHPSRFGGRNHYGGDGTQPLEGTVLPDEFGRRLELLKEISGLSWRGLARALGVDTKQLRRWRRNTEPCGGAMLTICRFARRFPGGLDVIFGEDSPMTSEEEDSNEEDDDEEEKES